MLAEIMATLKAIQSIAESFKYFNDQRKILMEQQEQKQIEDFKKGVRLELEQIKAATSDADRKRLIVELTRRMSQ